MSLLTKSLMFNKLLSNFSSSSRWVKIWDVGLKRCYSRYSLSKSNEWMKWNCVERILRSNAVAPRNGRAFQTFTNGLWTNKPEQCEDSSDSRNLDNALGDDPEVRKWLEEIRKDFENKDEIPNKSDLNKNASVQMSKSDVTEDAYLAPSLQKKYALFRDEDSKEIPSIEEVTETEVFSLYSQKKDEFAGLNLNRGTEGVYDIEELVEVLRKENLQSLCVIKVPSELHYCDYLVISSAISERHLVSTAEFLRKLYKKKKSTKDPYFVIEGKQCRNWQALDMGNIVLHIFMPEERSKYDLETLWTVGSKYDELMKQPVSDILLAIENNSILFSLDDVRPLEQSR